MSADLPLLTPDEEFNPYAPPTAAIGEPPLDLVPTDDLARAEAIRRAHIGHEAAVKSIGSLHILGTIFGLIGFGFGISVTVRPDRFLGAPNAQRLMIGVITGFYLLWSILHLALGIGLIRLQRWARWTDVVLISFSLFIVTFQGGISLYTNHVPELIGICVVAIIPGYMLYLLLAPKASVIFSPEYKTIIAQTPHIKSRTSPLLKIFLVMILVLMALGFVSYFVFS